MGARVLVAAMLAAAALCAAPPALTLHFPDAEGAPISPSSEVVVPSGAGKRFEFRIQNAFAPVKASTVRVALNRLPLSIFSRVNRLPSGVRVIVDLSRTLNSDYHFDPSRKNLLELEASDEAGNRYRGEFHVSLGTSEALEVTSEASSPVFKPKERFSSPEVEFNDENPEHTVSEYVTINAAVADEYGLREVEIFVNGKQTDTVLIENDAPVRKQGTFATLKDLPGRVEGNGSRLEVELPVRLKKPVNVITIQAVNAKGLRGRGAWTVTRQK